MVDDLVAEIPWKLVGRRKEHWGSFCGVLRLLVLLLLEKREVMEVEEEEVAMDIIIIL